MSRKKIVLICALIGLGFACLVGYNVYEQGMNAYHFMGNPNFLVIIVNNGWLVPLSLVMGLLTGLGIGLAFYLTFNYNYKEGKHE